MMLTGASDVNLLRDIVALVRGTDHLGHLYELDDHARVIQKLKHDQDMRDEAIERMERDLNVWTWPRKAP